MNADSTEITAPDVAALLAAEEYKDVIGRFASGVTLLTTEVDGEQHGATASALTSLSVDPPMLLICLKRDSNTRASIARRGAFAVNILREDQLELAVRFASKAPNKFDGVAVINGEMQLPLIDDALANLECRVTEEVVGGTHSVFLAEVKHVIARSGEPLAYYRGGFGRLNMSQDDSALNELRIRIIRGMVPMGQPLDLESIADGLGVSRTQAFQALSQLYIEGFVRRDDNGKFVAPTLTLDAVLDSTRARLALLMGAASMTCDQATEQDIDELREILKRSAPPNELTDESVLTMLSTRSQFLEWFVTKTGSSTMLDTSRRVDAPGMLFTLWSGGTALQDLKHVHAEHCAVVEAYRAKDIQGIASATNRLMDYLVERYLEIATQNPESIGL